MVFIEYGLTSDSLYLGERMKGNVFKPCLRTIPFSQISGALNARFGRSDFKAVGVFDGMSEFNRINYLTYSPRDRVFGTSKIPLQVEFLSNVSAKVFIFENEGTKILPAEFEIFLGGLKSKGFGRCFLRQQKRVDNLSPLRGTLNVRIPVEEKEYFNVRVINDSPVYGYLFKPIPGTFTGEYVLSLFEGSVVSAPKFLLKGVDDG